MESPMAGGESTPRITTARYSVIESILGCGLSGTRIGSDDLKMKLRIPDYLCRAMHGAIMQNNVEQKQWYSSIEHVFAPECPIVVFINAKSGGRYGIELTEQLQELIGEDQVFDLSTVTPFEFVEYGLGCLEALSLSGDICAQEAREKMRIMVAGGDGTVGWLLSSLQALNSKHRKPIPPVGIIPLGTGNDLARSFRWGGSFPFFWKSAVKRYLDRAITGEVCHLDSWRVMVLMPDREVASLPHTLKRTTDCCLSEIFGSDGPSLEASSCYEGLFYNYFSIGMDAQIAYGFHRLRNEKPFLAQGPISNKLIYSGYGCTQGWFFTPCTSSPSLRGIKNILKMWIKKVDSSEWDQIPIPKSVRAIVALNLHNYASGRNPWGSLKQDYLDKRGFVEARVDDGLLEIFGLKQGWHASFVMVELISAKHMAQATAVRLEIRGEREHAYMQMDGEPWKQSLSSDWSSLVTIERLPFQSLLIRGG